MGVLALEAAAAQPSVAFVNLYKSDACNYGSNSQDVTLADPQPGTYTNVVFSQVCRSGARGVVLPCVLQLLNMPAHTPHIFVHTARSIWESVRSHAGQQRRRYVRAFCINAGVIR